MKGSSPTDLAVDSPAGREGLIFDWKSGGFPHWKLAAFLMFSFVAHAFCFYLFQVVYPPSERFTPSPERITFLSSDDSRCRGLLRALEDRVVYFDSRSRSTVLESRIEDQTVAFTPSFAGFGLSLRRLPAGSSEARLPGAVEFARMVLPATPAQRGAGTEAGSPVARARTPSQPPAAGEARGEASGGGSAAPEIDLKGGVLGRVVEAPGDWGWAQDKMGELKGLGAVLMVSVSERGSVRHVLMHRGLGSSLDEEILATVKHFRFDPAPGDGLRSGVLELRW